MNKVSSFKKLGPLDVLEIPAQPGASYIVVFHGYGADAKDLLSFAHLLNAPTGTGWIFAQGPLKVSDSGIAGRAWFPLDLAYLDNAMREGRHIDMSGITPEGLKRARVMATEMIGELKVPASRLVLMGFSQGAMVATDLALRMSEKIAGLGILSGTLLNKELWGQRAKTKVGLEFFQSHGESDALLGVQYAKALEELLIGAGLKGQLNIFRGGHEVPQEIVHKLGQFLRKVLTPQN
jgi:phospholipase/carboxylesterase